MAGFSGAQAMSFAFPSLAALPVFYGQGFGLYLISCLAGFLIAFCVTMLFKFPGGSVGGGWGKSRKGIVFY